MGTRGLCLPVSRKSSEGASSGPSQGYIIWAVWPRSGRLRFWRRAGRPLLSVRRICRTCSSATRASFVCSRARDEVTGHPRLPVVRLAARLRARPGSTSRCRLPVRPGEPSVKATPDRLFVGSSHCGWWRSAALARRAARASSPCSAATTAEPSDASSTSRSELASTRPVNPRTPTCSGSRTAEIRWGDGRP
jgi:hypothetical protein